MLWTDMLATNYKRNVGSQFQMLWILLILSISSRQKESYSSLSEYFLLFISFSYLTKVKKQCDGLQTEVYAERLSAETFASAVYTMELE